jgi:hypothetical protein
MSSVSSLSSSPLSSAPSSDDEGAFKVARVGDAVQIIRNESEHSTPATTAEDSLPGSPTGKDRPPEPPHEYQFEDNYQIAVCYILGNGRKRVWSLTCRVLDGNRCW